MMVPHHQSAIEMARLAEQRATHAELKDLANRIISAQQSEIDQLRQWRQAWFGSSETPPMTAMPLMPGMSMPEHAGMSQGMGSMASASPGASKTAETMDMTADVEALRSADPFDREFIDAMIAHHQMAIEAATILTANGQRPELEALAQGIIAAQQKEIDQMKGWRAVWFPGA